MLQIRRIKPDDGIVGKVYRVLSDVESYTEIPYHSKRHGTTTPLYSYSKIRSDFINRDKHHFTTDMVMPPFELCTVEISIKTDHENFLLYKSKNLNPMTCMTFIRVKKDRLRSMISVFQHEDYWIIYGIGAAKAPKIPILTRRVETPLFRGWRLSAVLPRLFWTNSGGGNRRGYFSRGSGRGFSQIALITAPAIFLSRSDMASSLSASRRISGEYIFSLLVMGLFPVTRYSTETFKAPAIFTAISADGMELFSFR